VDDPDRDLVEAARGGDKKAFDALVRRHAKPLADLVRRYVKDAQRAEDVAQEALVRAFEKLPSFRQGSTFRTWLYRIAINLSLNQVRDDKAASWAALEDDTAFAKTIGTTQLTAAELWRRVSGHLAELPPKQRLAFELRIFHDLSFEEIAVVAGCNEITAKANYHHAVKRLRAFLVPTRS
jgi:RNA polymerase sigma-70 factor (ECF subfamily)